MLRDSSPRASSALVWLAAAVVLNSCVLGYALYSTRRLSDTIRTSLLMTVPLRSSGGQEDLAGKSPPLVVVFYSDMLCEYCRSSAASLDSARRHFGQRVTWEYRHLPQPPNVSRASFLSAVIGECVGPERLWDLFTRLSEMEAPDLTHVRAQAADLGISPDSLKRCEASRDLESRVWSQIFRASRIGVAAVPTLRVGGVTVSGAIGYETLTRLVSAKLDELTGPL